MSQLLLDCAQPCAPRLDPGGRFEHRGRGFLGARFALVHLGADRGQALAPRRLAVGEFFEPRVGLRDEPGDFLQAHAGLLVLAASGGRFALDAFQGTTPLAHRALGAREMVARLVEFAMRRLKHGARRLEGRAQRRGFGLGLLDARGRLFQRRRVGRRRLASSSSPGCGAAAAGDHFPRRYQVALASDEERAVAVQVRRRERGAQIVGDDHVTEHRFGDVAKAWLDFDHIEQAAGDSGRFDSGMGIGRAGLGDEA